MYMTHTIRLCVIKNLKILYLTIDDRVVLCIWPIPLGCVLSKTWRYNILSFRTLCWFLCLFEEKSMYILDMLLYCNTPLPRGLLPITICSSFLTSLLLFRDLIMQFKAKGIANFCLLPLRAQLLFFQFFETIQIVCVSKVLYTLVALG